MKSASKRKITHRKLSRSARQPTRQITNLNSTETLFRGLLMTQSSKLICQMDQWPKLSLIPYSQVKARCKSVTGIWSSEATLASSSLIVLARFRQSLQTLALHWMRLAEKLNCPVTKKISTTLWSCHVYHTLIPHKFTRLMSLARMVNRGSGQRTP